MCRATGLRAPAPAHEHPSFDAATASSNTWTLGDHALLATLQAQTAKDVAAREAFRVEVKRRLLGIAQTVHRNATKGCRVSFRSYFTRFPPGEVRVIAGATHSWRIRVGVRCWWGTFATSRLPRDSASRRARRGRAQEGGKRRRQEGRGRGRRRRSRGRRDRPMTAQASGSGPAAARQCPRACDRWLAGSSRSCGRAARRWAVFGPRHRRRWKDEVVAAIAQGWRRLKRDLTPTFGLSVSWRGAVRWSLRDLSAMLQRGTGIGAAGVVRPSARHVRDLLP